MVFVFPEAEPSGAVERWNSEGAVVSWQADGSCLCFSSTVLGRSFSWPHEADLTLVLKTFTQLTEVAKVVRGGHRQK